MSNVPRIESPAPDWPTVTLGDICRIEIGVTPARNAPVFWAEGDVGHYWAAISDLKSKYLTHTAERISDAGVRFSNAKPVPKGTVLMSFKLTLGRTAITARDLYTNEAIAAFYPRWDDLSPQWLYYALPRIAQGGFADQAVKGQTLNKKKLSSLTLQLPTIEEQQRIAEILDTIDAAIEKTEALIAKLSGMRAGLLHDLLTRGLDEQGRLRDPMARPEEFRDTPIGRFPITWELVAVEDAGEVRLGRQRSPRHQTGQFTTPYLRVANVLDGWIDYSDVLLMDFTPKERETYSLQYGDILLNEGQSLELVGRSAIFTGISDAYCFQNTLVRFRSNGTTIPSYCRMVFKFFLDTGRFAKVAKQTTSVAHLGADRFAKMAFLRPTLEEQRRIANCSEIEDARVRAEQATRNKLRQLRRGLMDDVLTGRVRAGTAVDPLGCANEDRGGNDRKQRRSPVPCGTSPS